jgi:thioesterase domain-containing protein
MAVICHHNANAGSLIQLRKGAPDAPLFLFSGGDGDPQHLSTLASHMCNARAVIGVDFCRHDQHDELPLTVEIMADHSCAAIRALQPDGPYHLVGYSFGGLVAIEVARLLRQSGQEIALVGLIDTRFDQRFWSTRIFLRSQAHLIHRHLTFLLGLPLNQIFPTFLYRSRRLFFRLVSRQVRSSRLTSTLVAKSTTVAERHCRTLMANYRPRYYAGKITSFEAETHDEYGCSPAELWHGMAAEIVRWTLPGTHIGVITDDVSCAALAAALDFTLTPRSASPGSSKESSVNKAQTD